MKRIGMGFACLILAGAGATASATTVEITATVVAFTDPDIPEGNVLGSLDAFLDLTGLPLSDKPGGQNASGTVLSATVTQPSGPTIFGTQGYADVFTETRFGNEVLEFAVTDANFGVGVQVPTDWTGDGPLIGAVNDEDELNRVGFEVDGLSFEGGRTFGFVIDPQSHVVTTVTPEPESMSLMLLGLASAGCAWLRVGRRRLLRS